MQVKLQQAWLSPVDLILRIVYNELGGISHKWFKIGLLLGIPHNVLKRFEKEADPLSASLDYWLKGNVTSEEAAPISWKSVVDALRSDHVGEPALAERIGKKYFQQDSKEDDQPGRF